MSTPAAKRRRVDAANAALRKPFQSPVIRRPKPEQSPPPAEGTPGTTGTPATAATPARRSSGEVYPRSPASPPSVLRRRQQQQQQQQQQQPHHQGLRLRPTRDRSLGALRQTRPASPPLRSPRAGVLARSVGDRRRSGDHAGRGGPAVVLGRHGGGGDVEDDGGDDNPFMALVRAHRTTDQEAMIRGLDRQLETARQAGRIEDASERRHPGGRVDQELRDLVVRWKGAGRLAADELFEMVKGRVDSAGGPKAWKAMQQRQLEFYRGLDQESPSRFEGAGGDHGYEDGEEDDKCAREELEGYHEEGRSQEAERARGNTHDDEDEDEDEPEFNMALMLRSLNIDPSLLGYDEAEEKWVD